MPLAGAQLQPLHAVEFVDKPLCSPAPTPTEGVVINRRWSILATLALALPLTAIAFPAQAESSSLKLESSTLTAYNPAATTHPCSQGNTACGFIGIQATFSGLDAVRDSLVGSFNQVPGEVKVTRTYGCQSGNERLRGYDVKVKTTEGLFTRRGLGFTVPAVGPDTLSVSTFAILGDAQPGNCPAGTQAALYEIKANNAKIRLTRGPFETRDFTIPGTATWEGAVPTPPIR